MFEKVMLGDYSLYQLSFTFFIYAFFGWCVEVAFAALKTGNLVNRGFLNGCVCPIYGIGAVIVLSMLNPIKDNFILLFIGATVLATVLEFITGFLLERLFHRKWWDYSREPFNLMGYVCLRFSLLWGVACLVLTKVVNPPIQAVVALLDVRGGNILLTVLYVVFITDIVLTILQIRKLNERYKMIGVLSGKLHDASDKLVAKIYKITMKGKNEAEQIAKKIEKSRLAKAFPQLKHEGMLPHKDDKN